MQRAEFFGVEEMNKLSLGQTQHSPLMFQTIELEGTETSIYQDGIGFSHAFGQIRRKLLKWQHAYQIWLCNLTTAINGMAFFNQGCSRMDWCVTGYVPLGFHEHSGIHQECVAVNTHPKIEPMAPFQELKSSRSLINAIVILYRDALFIVFFKWMDKLTLGENI